MFALQRALLGTQSFTTVTGKGDGGMPMPLPDGVRRVVLGVALPWIAFTLVVYLFAFAGGFVADLGPRLHARRCATSVTAFDVQSGEPTFAALVWAGTAWNSLFTTLKLAAIAAPLMRRARPAHRLAARAQRRSAAAALFEFARACWRSRFPAPCSA